MCPRGATRALRAREKIAASVHRRFRHPHAPHGAGSGLLRGSVRAARTGGYRRRPPRPSHKKVSLPQTDPTCSSTSCNGRPDAHVVRRDDHESSLFFSEKIPGQSVNNLTVHALINHENHDPLYARWSYNVRLEYKRRILKRRLNLVSC